MLPTYPNMTPNSAPYLYQSTRPDPTDTNICKPVAIISHDNSLTLVTCLQTNRAQNNQFICQHQEQRSNVSSIPRASLIQDLQRQSCCVYTMGQNGRSVQEPVAGASGATLVELKLDDLAAFMQIDDEQMNLSVPNDLDSHRVNEEVMQRLLPPEVVASGLPFTQQGASTSAASLNQTASTSTAALNQGTSMSGQATAATAFLNQPPRSAALTREKVRQLNSLQLYQKRVIYCLLEILESNKDRSFTRWELIDLIKEKYINFDNVRSDGVFTQAFAHAVSLKLIKKSGHHTKETGVIYSLEKYGSVVFQFLKEEVIPSLVLKTPATTHSNAGT